MQNPTHLITRLLIICIPFLSIYGQIVDKNPISIKKYPQQSLKCYSSLTKPDKQLICPASRANFCVKQVSSLTSDICGGTQYFGDEYVNGQCQFKKCNATCTPGSFSFTFQGQTYSRATYCCTTNYCNSSGSVTYSLLLCISCFLIVLYFLIL